MRYYRVIWRKYARKLLKLKGSTRDISLGFALGIFVGCTPTFGLQMIGILILNSLLGVNKLAGLVSVQISNFATAVPLYIFNFYVGSFLWEAKSPLTAERLEQVMNQQIFWYKSITDWGIRDEAKEVWWSFTLDVGGPLWLGSIIVGVILAILSYKPTYAAIERYRKAIIRRREVRHLRIMAHKEKEAASKRQASDSSTPETT